MELEVKLVLTLHKVIHFSIAIKNYSRKRRSLANRKQGIQSAIGIVTPGSGVFLLRSKFNVIKIPKFREVVGRRTKGKPIDLMEKDVASE